MRISILIILFLVFNFYDYFLAPYFIQPFSWLIVCITLIILSIAQAIKTFKERGNLKKSRILNLITTLLLLFLTGYNFNKIPSLVIEKLDWQVSYNQRKKIVEDVLANKLKPNTEMNNGICHLSFDFPILSNGGNDIWVSEDKNQGTKTIKFSIARGFFDSPQRYFVFTNDNETIKNYKEQIKNNPEVNWQLQENWFRIMERN